MKQLVDLGQKRLAIRCLTLFFIGMMSQAVGQDRNTAQKLGFDKDAKLLIVHADDIGVAHSVNRATISALEKKGVNSGSIMVPCAWFPEIADHARRNPSLDLGLHLTLTAEWKNYKWDGVLPNNEIPSLINQSGFFYASAEDVAKNAVPAEVENEISAQVERAIAFGIDPTHLDSHMGTLFQTPELFQIYQNVGKKYKIPVFVPMSWIGEVPELNAVLDPGIITVQSTVMVGPDVLADKWKDAYDQAIRELKPGLNELIVHLAYDDDEMQAVCIDHPDYGSAWRQRDYDYVVGREFKELLKAENINLVTYRQIKELIYGSER